MSAIYINLCFKLNVTEVGGVKIPQNSANVVYEYPIDSMVQKTYCTEPPLQAMLQWFENY